MELSDNAVPDVIDDVKEFEDFEAAAAHWLNFDDDQELIAIDGRRSKNHAKTLHTDGKPQSNCPFTCAVN